jgi:hypothetical protein
MHLKNVFGVSKEPVASYVERGAVDAGFAEALEGTRQIVVYGSSKQGKTALLQRHVPENKRIVVHCGPSMSAQDIYRSLLRQRGVQVLSEVSSLRGREINASISAKFKAIMPLFGGAEADTRGSASTTATSSEKRTPIELNLSSAQDVGELLLAIEGTKQLNVLENFHYLPDVVQHQLAFDLRTFEEMGMRFVILGVWRERNRLVQYNGDLQDRIAEVPVEPWHDADFGRIVAAGEIKLRIELSHQIKQRIYAQAHGSVAVVQELLKKLCEVASIHEAQQYKVVIDDNELLDQAIREKVEEYTTRHIRSLEAIAAGSRTRRASEGTAALFLPYYFVRVLVQRNYEELRNGIERRSLLELIRMEHNQPDNIRTSDLTGMLSRLGQLQANCQIVPPLFDYDRGTRRVKIVDSTLYFFIDNCDPYDVMDGIPYPGEAAFDE